jgi:hypothetical protein
MGVAEILLIIDKLFGLVYGLHNIAKMLSGDKPIPTIEEIAAKNAALQAKIDAELGR